MTETISTGIPPITSAEFLNGNHDTPELSAEEALYLLAYQDAASVTDEEKQATLEKVRNDEGNAATYAQELQKMCVEVGKENVLELADRMVAAAVTLTRAVGLQGSPNVVSRTWALWDMAKQRVLMSRASDPDYKYRGVVGDAITNNHYRLDLVKRQLGWEIDYAVAQQGLAGNIEPRFSGERWAAMVGIMHGRRNGGMHGLNSLGLLNLGTEAVRGLSEVSLRIEEFKPEAYQDEDRKTKVWDALNEASAGVQDFQPRIAALQDWVPHGRTPASPPLPPPHTDSRGDVFAPANRYAVHMGQRPPGDLRAGSSSSTAEELAELAALSRSQPASEQPSSAPSGDPPFDQAAHTRAILERQEEARQEQTDDAYDWHPITTSMTSEEKQWARRWNGIQEFKRKEPMSKLFLHDRTVRRAARGLPPDDENPYRNL